jgi:Holliday junction resolvase-like predicted endonuclease
VLLIAKGYRIAARRWKTLLGENRPRRRRRLALVEVKAHERAERRPKQ